MRKSYRWILAIAGIVALIAAIQVTRHFHREREREARIRLRRALMAEYPETVEALKARYGLRRFRPSQGLKEGGATRSKVILVHGLDDPGKVWMNLAPALVAEGYAVWILTYPNDQPVAVSARFFLEELQSGDLVGAGRIAIVAHSMGGLVSREMLTDPALGYDARSKSGEVPRIDQLIMVGTPNHGSELARFGDLGEFRDQLEKILKGDYHWLDGIVDGAGEAGIDLIPGSAFLQRLNGRPHPANVHMLVIAGVMSPTQKQDIQAQARKLEQKLPGAARDLTRRMADGLIAMAEQVGDGLVSVASAQLPGVPLKTVPGTHLSMIRNLTAESQRMPPAIPIVVEGLHQARMGE
jgi:pimeloyl-ACP methyl ester carboxylesterase